MDMIRVPYEDLEELSHEMLKVAGVPHNIASSVVEALLFASVRGVDSHGIRLLPHYLRELKAGRINPKPKMQFTQTAPATGIVDADHTFGPTATVFAMDKAIHMAGECGVAAVSVKNSTHFGPAGYYAELAAKKDCIGFAMTHADSLMKSHNGTRAYFGTNPIAFSAPLEGEGPLCLDMATSRVNWNKVRQMRERGERLPDGWAADKEGKETDDPHEARALLPAGEYKGFGLSMMVEVLCGVLSGMPFGRNIVDMYTEPISRKRFLGHFVCVIDVSKFGDTNEFKKRMTEMVREVRSEPALDSKKPVVVSGDPEKKIKNDRMKTGIPFTKSEWEAFCAAGKELDVHL